MDDRYKCHVPERVETVKPLGSPAVRPRPAEAPARGGAYGAARADRDAKPRELGGPSGPEPTRYGDWERGGRCVDF